MNDDNGRTLGLGRPTGSSDPHRLDGRVAVVTGAARGLGAATAAVLAGLGARVAVLDVDGAGAESTAKEIVGSGGEAVGLEVDITDADAVERAADEVVGRYGTCDILVNNAGVVLWSPLEETTPETWNRSLAVNLTGHFLCTRSFARPMLAQGSGNIVFVSSIASSIPEAHAGSYSPAKAGVVVLARQIAVEWGPRGIRANTVSPAMFRTPMSEGFHGNADALAQRERMVPLGRIGQPPELARAIAYLVSDASSYVNGHELQVDGGLAQMLVRLLPHPGAIAPEREIPVGGGTNYG